VEGAKILVKNGANVKYEKIIFMTNQNWTNQILLLLKFDTKSSQGSGTGLPFEREDQQKNCRDLNMVSRQNLIRCCYLIAFMVSYVLRTKCINCLQITIKMLFVILKDLFAVGMLLPLFSRRGRALGASPSTLGAIG
jgi:hypothetical protein